MATLFIHLSREKIMLQGTGFQEELEYMDIERKLPPCVIDLIETYSISDVFVLNGPGSFTTLRLGCLTLNTIKQYGLPPGIRLHSCSKLDLYRYLYQQGLLPGTGYLFIGQKKNMWKIIRTEEVGDGYTAGWRTIIVNQDTIDHPASGEYFIDPCEHVLIDMFDRQQMLDIFFDGLLLQVSYGGKSTSISLEAVCVEKVDELIPNYLIEPQIG